MRKKSIGEKITQAIRESEKWTELEFMPMFIPNPSLLYVPRNKSQIHDFDFSTISEIADLLLEGEVKEK